MIEFGEGRGYINKKNNMKVICENEGVWIKVIALNHNTNQVIGILQNQPLNKKYSWGEIVIAKETDPKQIFKITKKIIEIPKKNWTTEIQKIVSKNKRRK